MYNRREPDGETERDEEFLAAGESPDASPPSAGVVEDFEFEPGFSDPAGGVVGAVETVSSAVNALEEPVRRRRDGGEHDPENIPL